MWGGNIPSTLAGEFSFSLALALAFLFLGVLRKSIEARKGYVWPGLLVAFIGLSHGLVDAMAARGPAGRTLTLFLGSNIGNFDPPGADEFLLSVRASLASGDALLIGTDLVKPERDLLLAYDDPLGVTAAFNRNLLVRINRELGADFDVSAFRHRALWNGAESRVEMHLVAARKQQVRIPAASLEVTFEEGETIWTESSYKYRPDDVVRMLERDGFRRVEQWMDEADGFALTLVEAV